MADLSKLLGPSWMSLQDTLSKTLRPFPEPAHIAGIRDMLERQSAVAKAARGITENFSSLSEYATTFHAAQRMMEGIDLRGVTAAGKAMQRAMLPYDKLSVAGGFMSELQRVNRWADVLGAASMPQLGELVAMPEKLQSDLNKLHDVSRHMREFLSAHEIAVEAAQHRIRFAASLDATVLKLSTFSGASALFQPGNALSGAAFDALFGRYRTTIDLPPAFWRRSEVRREFYERADVDTGLIEAENDEAVEILIGGGVATHIDGRGGRSIAVVSFGQFEMRVTSTRTRHDAFAIVDAFEISLRQFVTRKLTELSGPEWFKHRVNGNVVGRVKDRRREALRNGEQHAPLIDFSDLGDLLTIIMRSDNWGAVFEATFQHADRFRVDMERLIAMRRPTAHARSIDAVRLLEIVCVARRLQSAMDYDRALDDGWNADQ